MSEASTGAACKAAPITLSLLLAACGGGGGDSVTVNVPAPEPTPAPEPLAVATERAFPGLSFEAPMAMVPLPGEPDQWFLIERAGRLLRFDDRQDASSAEVVLDIRDRVSATGEGGLLGLALHPDFVTNGRLFLSYTAPGAPLESRIAEFVSVDGGQSFAADSEQIRLTVLQDASNHNGGHMAFGPDGFLYLGLGDGGGSNDPNGRAQDTGNLLGAMLRLDVDVPTGYAIPTDNPFAGNADCVQGFGAADCPEIFAWGLRNPWRWSFDSATGDLWLGDVGQGDWEEINRIEVGRNYGWPIREGANCNPNLGGDPCDATGLTDPIAEYPHELGRSVTGGFVYRGGGIPALAGSYVFGDFTSGTVWRLDEDNDLEELFDSDWRLVSLAEDAAGELYVIDLAGGGVHRLVDANP